MGEEKKWFNLKKGEPTWGRMHFCFLQYAFVKEAEGIRNSYVNLWRGEIEYIYSCEAGLAIFISISLMLTAEKTAM